MTGREKLVQRIIVLTVIVCLTLSIVTAIRGTAPHS